jgi:spore cortex formation protein SpoVR/YcgB (stage V sporulation)
LHHQVLNRTLLHKDDALRVLQMVANLWGYAVVLKEVEPATGAIFQEHVAHPHETLF